MTRYVAVLDGRREETVEVTQLGSGLYEVTVGDRRHRVDAFIHDFGTMSLLVDGRSFSAHIDRRQADVRVQVGDSACRVDVLDERRLRTRRAVSRFTPAGRQTLAAVLPGKVVKRIAKVGDEVKEGQGLVVIEAMEMQNVVKSPKDGRLVELHVEEGQAVEGGAKLAVIE